jgi:hypothetical protein
MNSLLLKAGKLVLGFFVSLLLGIIGGGVCGAAILVLGGLIGRSGSTGDEYLGYSSIDLVRLGLLYGGFFGVFVGPVDYALFVHRIGFRKGLVPAFVGTLVGGFAGALAAPMLAVTTGIFGFFVALTWATIKDAADESPSVPD